MSVIEDFTEGMNRLLDEAAALENERADVEARERQLLTEGADLFGPDLQETERRLEAYWSRKYEIEDEGKFLVSVEVERRRAALRGTYCRE